MRWGLGPVFVYQCITNARRWQVYATRSLGVAALLAGMAVIAWANGGLLSGNSAQEYARLGEHYYYALIGVELTLVLLAAPAATAGAICQDRSQGTLSHILATDLSDHEIVLGKLAARLLPVLGLVACTWPVMALASLLGGIDPLSLTAAFAVIIGVAVLGCSLALVLSVWAQKPHDVVVLIYTIWALVIVAYPVMWLMALARLTAGPPRWLLLMDPYYLAYAPYVAPARVGLSDFLVFLATALGASTVLVLIAIGRMRPVTSRGQERRRSKTGLGWLGRIRRWLPGPSLDGNPVLWREWRRGRPSTWAAALVAILLGTTTVACISGAFSCWIYGIAPGPMAGSGVIAGWFGEVLQVVFGLLILAALAPLSLAEERRQGSLDVLVVTPLPSRSIVLAKWLGTFRLVPLLAIGPGLVGLAMATARSNARVAPAAPGVVMAVFGDLDLWQRLFAAVLLFGTILAHGALYTSVGLAFATWIKRPSRAIALSVGVFVMLAVAWPILAYTVLRGAPLSVESVAVLSPITTAALMIDVLMTRFEWRMHILWSVAFWDAMAAYCALVLLWLTIRSFDASLGRTPDRVERSSILADLLVVFAGGIGIVCTAGAIALWARGFALPSLTYNEVLILRYSIAVVMTGLLMLTAIAAFDNPVERSTPWATTLARWWRTFRLALPLAVGPAVLAVALATVRTVGNDAQLPDLPASLGALRPSNLGYRLVVVVLLLATILAHGAAATAVSLALRASTNRPGVTAALSAALFLVVPIACSYLALGFGPRDPSGLPPPYRAGWAMMSIPVAGTSLLAQLVMHQPQLIGIAEWAAFWVVFWTLLTVWLLRLTSRWVKYPRITRSQDDARRSRYATCVSPPHSIERAPLPSIGIASIDRPKLNGD